MTLLSFIRSKIMPSLLSLCILALPLAAEAQGKLAFKWESYIRFGSIEDLLLGILQILITLAIPIIVFFIIYAGFKYVTAQGNPQQIQEATRTLTYAIIGAVLIIGAVAFAEIAKNTIEAFKK